MFNRKYTDTEQKKLLKTLTILVDTREHKGKNDHILSYLDQNNLPWERRKLDAGDYSCLLPANPNLDIPEDVDFSSQIMVERKKDLDELSGNFVETKSNQKPGQRIRNEFARSPAHKVLLIENATYDKLARGDYTSGLNPNAFRGKLLSLWHQYNAPVFFMPDNKYSGEFIYYYFYYYLRGLLKA